MDHLGERTANTNSGCFLEAGRCLKGLTRNYYGARLRAENTSGAWSRLPVPDPFLPLIFEDLVGCVDSETGAIPY